MQGRRQKNLVLILAREFASQLATPMLLIDGSGDLVFYNEPAEMILGRSFAEVGELNAREWPELWRVEHLDGSPMSLEEMPGGIALLERRETHASFRITGLDGVSRAISATGLPLLAREGELVGVVAVFWEEG